MASRAIRHVFYRPEAEELSVWFAGSIRRYKYFDVPEDLYRAMLIAPSRGGFFNRHIKGRFECALVGDEKRRKSA